MERFKAYIKGEGGAPDAKALDGLVSQYPWFATARLVRDGAAGAKSVGAGDFRTLAGEILIDSFLSHGEYRIVPGEQAAEEDAAAVPEGFVPGIVTEQLAGIYMSQQLWAQAKTAYEKLSLLYPEKSVYFAEIIERIDARTNSQNN